ncbi:MAG: acetoin utilization protein AcuC [Actinomycetes bacterium]
MSGSTRIIWDESMTRYDFGPDHPMSPVRIDLTIRLARELGLLDRGGVQVTGAEPADDPRLQTVHDPGYIDAVRRAANHPGTVDLVHGLGTEDNPVFPGIHEASARIVGASVQAAEVVWTGLVEHAVNIAGGLHHAMPAAASGFCVYNDAAVAIHRLLELGAQRVVYLDLDAHHGDGVEHVFWDEPRVLTVSLHESGRTLFPGTGFPEDTGGSAAPGGAVNVALPAGTGDSGWLRAFHAVVPALVEAFVPEVVVSQHGADSHFLDPLAHLALSVDAQRCAYAVVHELAHRFAGGRWVALGGGGYEIVDVVPRTWSHLVAIAAGHPVPPTTLVPEGWRSYVRDALGRVAPARMTDGREPTYRLWESGYDPADRVDQAILATRRAVFPAHGLDPYLWP